MSKPAPRQIQVTITEAEHRRLKMEALKAGVPTRDYAGEILRRWLKGERQ